MRPRSGARRTRRSPTACARARSTSSPASRSCRARALLAPRDRGGPRPVDALLRAARHRQDDARAIIAASTQSVFEELSAVLVGQGRRAGRDRPGARAARRAGQRTVLFIDEIHRFNKAQQDALLPHRRVRARDADRRDDREPVPFGRSARCLALPAVRVHEPLARTRCWRVLERGARPRSAIRRPSARCSPRSPRPPPATRATRSRRSSSRTSMRARAAIATRRGRGRHRSGHAPARALRPRRRQPLHTISAYIKSVRGERSRRRALLPRGDARGRRGSASTSRADRDPRQRGHRQRRPARARGGRRLRARRRAGRAARVHVTRSHRRPRTSRWHPSRTPRATSLGAARRPRARTRPPARRRPCATRTTAAPASSAAASATAIRTTRRARSWPTTTCRPSSPARTSTSPTEHGLEAKLAERMRELRRLRGAATADGARGPL